MLMGCYLLSESACVAPTNKFDCFVFLFEPNLPETQISKGELGRIFAK